LAAVVALLILFCYVVSANSVGVFFLESHDQNLEVRYVTAYLVSERAAKFVLAVLVNFAVTSPGAQLGVTLAIELSLCALVWWKTPCNVGWVNYVKVCLLSMSAWSTIAALMGLAGWSDPGPIAIMYGGWAVLLAVTVVVWYLHPPKPLPEYKPTAAEFYALDGVFFDEAMSPAAVGKHVDIPMSAIGLGTGASS